MNKVLKNVLLAGLLFTLFAAVTVIKGKVVGVTDGDTIKVLTKDNEEIKIRLYGIDCPEKKQAFGSKAKEFTSGLVFGKTVTVKGHSMDRYGRVIGEVILEDGINVNQEIVKNGFAWWYKQFAKKDTGLESLEKDAKIKKIGLWQDKDPTPPWEWRNKKRKPDAHR